MKKISIIISLVSSIIFAVACWALTITPGFSSLIWIFFSTFAFISLLNGEFKKVHIYISAIMLGWVWAYLYHYTTEYCIILFGMSFPIAMLVSVFIGTFIISIAHSIILEKTPFNITLMPICFASVIAFFGTMGQDLSKINIFAAQILGILLAVLIPIISGIIAKSCMGKESAVAEKYK